MTPVTKASDLAAGSKLTVGGADMDPTLAGRVVELRVETTTGLPDVCVIRFAEDQAADADAGLPVIDSSVLKLGAPLAVKLAKPLGGSLSPVFDGEITSIEAELGAGFGGGMQMELTVVAHDRSHRMHGKSNARTLRQMTLKDIAGKVAGEHGLAVAKLADLKGGAFEEVHQTGESDWAFLSRLVREQGGELDVEQGKLSIIDPKAAVSSVATLVYGESLRHFRARVASLGQVAEVTVRGWDAKRKQVITQAAKPKAATSTAAAPVDAQVNGTKALIATGRVETTADAKAQAEGLAARIGHERVQGDAVTAGDPLLLAGTQVTVAGVGTRFKGSYRVVSAVHVISGAMGYETRLVLGSGGRPLAEAVRGGTAPADFSANLSIAVVTNVKDPEDRGRVKVKYPTLAAEMESGWARVVQLAAGKERGIVALPHVDDEVVVAFESGDVHKPYVLGALFNGVDKPGADLVKAASSYAARFPRDIDVLTKEKGILAAEKGATVTTANGPLELKAGKDVKISAGAGGSGGVTIEATGQVKAEGKQGVEIASNGPIKIKTTAPITIESSAALQLKGTMVQVQASAVLQLSGATVMLG